MTYRDTVEAGARRLAAAGVPDPDWDAACLWEKAAGMSRAAYLTHREEPAPPEAADSAAISVRPPEAAPSSQKEKL